ALETRGRRLTRGTRRGGKTGVTVLRTVTRMTTGVAGELIRGPFRSGGQEGRPAGRRTVVAAGNGFVGSIAPAQKPRPLCHLRCSDLRQPALAAVARHRPVHSRLSRPIEDAKMDGVEIGARTSRGVR